MLSYSLDIHGLKASRVTLVFFLHKTKYMYSSVVELWICYQKVGGSNPSWGNHYTHAKYYAVIFSGIKHLLDTSFSGFKFFGTLAVANFTNINSNEQFCLVGYMTYKVAFRSNQSVYEYHWSEGLVVTSIFHRSLSLTVQSTKTI